MNRRGFLRALFGAPLAMPAMVAASALPVVGVDLQADGIYFGAPIGKFISTLEPARDWQFPPEVLRALYLSWSAENREWIDWRRAA